MDEVPADTVFVLLCFEGPDPYSLAGGVGVRSRELARSLAGQGFSTHLYFVGDPALPAVQESAGVHLHRWAQWLSRSHPAGVYDGEEQKVREWSRSLPAHLVEQVVTPAAAAGRRVVILAEEWHTADSVGLISDALTYQDLRSRAVMLWNANGLFGFDRINWPALQAASAVTTVSRYMKHRMWQWQVDPIVIPNGIPEAALEGPSEAEARALRQAVAADLLCFKIGRFHPDKGWLLAMTALGLLKRSGRKVRLLMRGGREPHGRDVLAHAAAQGLRVEGVPSPVRPAELATLIKAHPEADVLELTTFLPDALLPLVYSAADVVLANSRHEPFGLVGLEAMAAGGVALTGSTGEDYAMPFRNSLALETDDPLELVAALELLQGRPELAGRLREGGRQTARDYTWNRVIVQLLYWIELAARRQGVQPYAADARASA
jgi:glycosyltransferase involved in cell wall biosynthesis